VAENAEIRALREAESALWGIRTNHSMGSRIAHVGLTVEILHVTFRADGQLVSRTTPLQTYFPSEAMSGRPPFGLQPGRNMIPGIEGEEGVEDAGQTRIPTYFKRHNGREEFVSMARSRDSKTAVDGIWATSAKEIGLGYEV